MPRIASLLSSATEILYGLGLGESIVGVGHECDWPPPAREKPRLTICHIDSEASSGNIDRQVKQRLAAGLPLYEVDHQQLAQLSPDVIITQDQCDVCAVKYEDVLDAVADTPSLRNSTVVALNPMSLDDVLADIERVAEITGAADRAAAWLAELSERLGEVESITRSMPTSERPRTAIIEWTNPLMLAANWTPQLVELAGGRCELTQPGVHSSTIDWNDVRTFDPEVIVVAPCGLSLARSEQEVETLKEWPGWRGITAVREDRVHAVDGNAYLNRAGPRLIDSVEILANLLHPKLFAPPVLA